MDLQIDPEELNKCVQCGLCMPACPTYRATGDETLSPRGRIALMRAVQDEGATVHGEILDSFETCIQCRGCEPACPSGVPYGHLIEQARGELTRAGIVTPWWQRRSFTLLQHPRLLRLATRALAIGQRLRLVPQQLDIGVRLPLAPPPPLRYVASDHPDVLIFTGCVMDAWQRSVHQASIDVFEAAGFSVQPTGDGAPCCGALHVHAGLTNRAEVLARQVMDALTPGDGKDPDSLPAIVVDSAGCGAAMKEYGALLGTETAADFSARVFDIYEYLALHQHRLPSAPPLKQHVTIQDPCHLRHVQKVHTATRTVLRPYVSELRELDDDGLCCGAGGAYSLTQPEMAGKVRDLKVASIQRADGDVVVSANPGCAMHLAKGGVETVHPIQLVAEALSQKT